MATCRTIGGVRYDLTPSRSTGACARGRPPAEQKTAPPASSRSKAAAPTKADFDRLYTAARDWAEAEAEKVGSGPLPVWLPPFSIASKLAAAEGMPGRGEDVQRLAGDAWQRMRALRKTVQDSKSPALKAKYENKLPPEVEEAIARGILPDEAEQKRRNDRIFDRPKVAKPTASLYVETAGGMDPRVSDFDRRRQKRVPLPKPIDPRTAMRGQRVSVFYYQSNDPQHAILTGLPGDESMYGRVETEPSVRFESGSSEGMNRFVKWPQVYPGWLNRATNWKPWKG